MRYVCFSFSCFLFSGEGGIVECKVSLAILGIEIEREGGRMMLIVHLFTYAYKSLLWFLVLG